MGLSLCCFGPQVEPEYFTKHDLHTVAGEYNSFHYGEGNVQVSKSAHAKEG